MGKHDEKNGGGPKQNHFCLVHYMLQTNIFTQYCVKIRPNGRHELAFF